ncbi:hypothetical protein LJC20_00845 [Eubacteriales bacterium OttesenSCG-928-M02]|nr:hypothetical protein [Eubacteriales bacterium OttesenSCG-928-M02]
MRDDLVLHVQMFDGFSIQNEHYAYTKDTSRAKQVSALLEYLIANRKSEITRANLVEALWPEDNSNNPEGALRNLVYRARTEMEHFFPEDAKVECILRKNDAYAWNPDVAMVVDIDLFETYYSQALHVQEEEEKYQLLKQLIEIYKGEFLPESADNSWVMFKSIYYSRRYIESVLFVCGYLLRRERYPEIIDLCEKALRTQQVNERIHEYYLLALYQMGEVQQAIDYYYYVVDLLYTKLGEEASDSLKEIYQRIVKNMPDERFNLERLEDNLKMADGDDDGSYYCNYDVFRSIYQVNARSVRRSRTAKFLILLSLTDESGMAKKREYEAAMELLRDIIYKVLRKNDVFTQFSPTQYSILLSATNLDSCMIAVNRIKDRFTKRNKQEEIRLLVEVKQISQPQ